MDWRTAAPACRAVPQDGSVAPGALVSPSEPEYQTGGLLSGMRGPGGGAGFSPWSSLRPRRESGQKSGLCEPTLGFVDNRCIGGISQILQIYAGEADWLRSGNRLARSAVIPTKKNIRKCLFSNSRRCKIFSCVLPALVESNIAVSRHNNARY